MGSSNNYHILYLDAHDSFANNVIALVETALDVQVTRLYIDDTVNNVRDFLHRFNALVLGPGPGDPACSADVGLFKPLVDEAKVQNLPILGICLGLQYLVLHFGGTVERLRQPRHGLIRTVNCSHQSIFKGIPCPIRAVQYHSLHATLGTSADRGDPQLEATAWDYANDNPDNEGRHAENPDSILMAVQHVSKPFHAVQFHPESICSGDFGIVMVRNWWSLVVGSRMSRDELPYGGKLSPFLHLRDRQAHSTCSTLSCEHIDRLTRSVPSVCDQQSESRKSGPPALLCGILEDTKLSLTTIVTELDQQPSRIITFDSENHQRPELGEFSIIGLIEDHSELIEYHATSGIVSTGRYDTQDHRHRRLDKCSAGFFEFLSEFMHARSTTNGIPDVPFWGGLIGFIDYECGLETIGAYKSQAANEHYDQRPNSSFIYIERSIIIAHAQHKVFVQSLQQDDQAWIDGMISRLSASSKSTPEAMRLELGHCNIALPNQQEYERKVRAAQAELAAGNSYEICLTTHASVERLRATDHDDAWQLYQHLRQKNPAPFAAYLRLQNLTLLSSSPERFLSWNRPQPWRTEREISDRGIGKIDTDSGLIIKCQFRPIKGTVRKERQTFGTTNGEQIKKPPRAKPVTLAEASRILSTPKEIAENLMIVDLIRHDLHGVVGSGNVHVPKLMVVEEYKTLYQLVSVIEGTLRIPRPPENSCAYLEPQHLNGNKSTIRKSGISILAASLPPGSMTGAPKLRTCQLLQNNNMEAHRPRGVYSGVVGYLDVGGGGDFSVVIRSAVRWSDRSVDTNRLKHSDNKETWEVGAGGAVTALSTPRDEYEEMMGKMRSTLRVFEGEGVAYRTRKAQWPERGG